MGFLDECREYWILMTVAEREALLKKLHETMEFAPVWDDVPAEALAHIPDFDSLPGDLCGHLEMAASNNSFSAERFAQRLRLFCPEKSALLDLDDWLGGEAEA